MRHLATAVKRRAGAVVATIAMTAGLTTVGSIAAPTAAHAAVCADASGITAVVDYANLGGVEERCGAGATARAALKSAGVSMAGGPGGTDTVCRVNGKPDAGEECWGRTSDHWYLFVSRQGGPWSAATVGIDAVRVKPGDAVALKWQGTNKIVPPSVKAPSFAAPVPTPAPKPTPAPTKDAPVKEKPKAAPDTEAKEPRSPRSATAAPTPSQDPTASVATTNSAADATETAAPPTAAATATESTPAEDQTAMAEPQVTPADEVSPEIATEDQAAAGDVQESDDDGMPIWALLGAVLLLVGVSAFAVLRRKRVS